jgi:hypothetical protein
VDVDLPVAEISPRHFGQNFAWWNTSDWLARPAVARRARAGGFRFLRFPGGSSSDEYFWDLDYGEFTQWASPHEPWAVDLDEFLAFCEKTRAEPIFTVNYGLARVGSLERAADLAARWVREVNVERGLGVKFWEIGNEVFGDWETGHLVPGEPELTGDAYGRDFVEIAKAMKAVDPTIWVGAPAAETGGAYGDWNRRMFPVIQEAADYLIVHIYFVWPFTGPGGAYVEPSAESLLANVPEVGHLKERVAAMERSYTNRRDPWPVAFTEFNIMNAPARPAVTLVNGLFTAEVLGEAIQAGYLAVNIWDARNGWDPLGGDFGMFALGDPATPDDTPRASYYAYVIYQRLFRGEMVESTVRGAPIRAYASWDARSHSVGLVLVNESREPVRVTLAPRALRRPARAWVLEGPELYGSEVRFNGVSGPPGGGPFPIPKKRGLPVDLSRGRVDLPGYSVTGLAIEGVQ